MKTMVSIIALAALCLSGCATYETATAGGVTTIDVENTGWYLFCCTPLASGDPNCPNENETMAFDDTVTLDNNMKILRKAMAKTGATRAENIVSHTTDEKFIFFLLKRRAIHTSAELSK